MIMANYDDITTADEYQHIKELFKDTDIKTRTELNSEQIRATNLLNTLAGVLNNALLKSHMEDFMQRQVSKDRFSRREYVESIKSSLEHNEIKQGGFRNWLTGR